MENSHLVVGARKLHYEDIMIYIKVYILVLGGHGYLPDKVFN